MILNANKHTWVKPAFIATVCLTVVVLWLYLSGGIFLVAFDRKFDEATPLTIYKYWFYYGHEVKAMRWIYIAMGVSALLVFVPMIWILSPAKRALFGEASFATTKDVRLSGLFATTGIILGKFKGKYLMLDGEQHAILGAPTRSGKGVGIVIPNLLNWPDSVVVLDIKQENHEITSGFRKRHGQAVYLFNPLAVDYRSHRYNPLAYISDNPNFRIDDTQAIAGMLFPDQQGTDPIWTATPRSLFLGIVLYLLETPGKMVTLGQVLRETVAFGDGSKYFARIINERMDGKGGVPLSRACVQALNIYVTIASANTRAGIMTGFRSRLELWNNPLVDAATSENDFDLRDVRKKRMSIFIGVTPNNLERVAPLVNLFFQQLIDLNTRTLPKQDKSIKYKCLLLMDEFTAPGKIPILSKGISYLAGYWMRVLPIIQSSSQVVDIYGKEAAKTFTVNHAVQIIFPPKATETEEAEAISKWLGYNTVEGISSSEKAGWFVKKGKSESTSEQRRALLLPQEIIGMGEQNCFVIMENCPPIFAQKIRYYEDPNFKDRLLPQVAVKLIDLEAHAALVGLDAPPMSSVAVDDEGGGESVKVERPITAADVPKLAFMALNDFAVQFSEVTIPEGKELDVAAIQALADLRCKEAGISF